MSKVIQLRNVPDALHRLLKRRAAGAGMSLSDYLLMEIKEIAERPTLAELRKRLNSRKMPWNPTPPLGKKSSPVVVTSRRVVRRES